MTSLFMTSGATISDCGIYRYKLWRTWDGTLPPVTFVMLNPSTADHERDDPTIRRCLDFARRWGCGSLRVVNLFALRSPDPAALRTAADAVGPENDGTILEACGAGLTVAAWGAHPFAVRRVRRVLELLNGAGARLRCLGVTKEGHPRHPLYVKGDVTLIEFGMAD
jgi:hypothetical protein